MNRFRPQQLSQRYRIGQRLRLGRVENHTWQTRVEWHPVGYRLNRRTILRQFGRLHYLACHAPKPVQQKWQKTYDIFYKKHFGDLRCASMRYLNTWSCHYWL